MHINQQQSSNTSKKDIILQLLQSSVLKQRNLNDKISHEEISRLIDDIISSSEGDTVKLRRSKRNLPSLLLPVFMLGVQTVALGSLGLAVGAPDFALIMYRVLSTQRGREIVRDLIDKALEGKDIMDTIEDLRRTGLFKTNEEQVTEVPQVTEGQQVTEIPQTTERQQLTGVPQVTEVSYTTDGQQVTEIPQTTEGQQVTEMPQVTEVPYTTDGQQATAEGQQVTEVPKTTEEQHVTEDYSNTSLHRAAEQGNLNAVKYFVERGADVNAKDENGETSLHLAAEQGNLDIVKYLVEKGADVNAKGWHGSILLGYAIQGSRYSARGGELDVVKYLVEKGAGLNLKDDDYRGFAPLHYAADLNGRLDIVKYLIDRGADINIKSDYGSTPLHIAAKGGRYVAWGGELDVVKYLVEQGADFCAKNNGGKTPLHYAAETGGVDIVKYLVEQGADVDAKDKKGDTPLHEAASAGNLGKVRYLVEQGADLMAKDKKGNTPLHEAVHSDRLDVVKYLINRRANLNAKNDYGRTPLHEAASVGSFSAVKYLVEKGADLMAKDKEGDTPLDIANLSLVVEFLKQAQANHHRDRRDLASSNSWTSNSIVNWVKGLISSTNSPALLTSTGHDNTTVTAVPEINTTVVNNTLMLGILATSLFNKTQHKQPIHENLLSPREQSMRRIDMDMIMRAIQQGEEKFGDPDTKMNEVKISGNKTEMWKRGK